MDFTLQLEYLADRLHSAIIAGSVILAVGYVLGRILGRVRMPEDLP